MKNKSFKRIARKRKKKKEGSKRDEKFCGATIVMNVQTSKPKIKLHFFGAQIPVIPPFLRLCLGESVLVSVCFSFMVFGWFFNLVLRKKSKNIFYL